MEEELKQKIKTLKKNHRENLKTIMKLEEENKELKSDNYFKLDNDTSKGVQEMWFEIKESNIPQHGNSVFARRPFKEGDVVMRSRIIRFPASDLNPNAVLGRYVGNVGDGSVFLTLDYQALVLDSKDNYNVQATWRLKDGISEYIATKDIAVGDEIYMPFTKPNKIN